jgi:capsid protein
MSLFSRIVGAFRTPDAAPLDALQPAGDSASVYEAANPSARRGRIPGGSPADHKVDLDDFTRHELVKGSRYSRKSSGMYREHIDLMHLYAVGPNGIKAQSQVENRDERNALEDHFKSWCRVADLGRRFSFAQVQKLVSTTMDTDGEVYVIKTRDPRTLAPRLQVIEGHRVGDFGKGDTWDGHKLNNIGQTTHIRILQDNGTTRDFPAGSIIHIFDPEYPSSLRSAPIGAHALLHMQDEGEMLALEKHGVKDNQDITRVLTLNAGALEDDGDFNPLGNTGTDSVSDPKALQRIVGGKLVTVYPGEKIESFESKRPSPAFTGFLEHLRRDSSLGILPYSVSVDASGINAGAIRVDVAKAQRRFEARQALIFEKLIVPAWFYVIGIGIDRAELPPIKNWWKITPGTPRTFTVDAGRNEESNRRDVEMGLKTPGDSYTEAGGDFLEAMERKAQELAGLDAIAKKYQMDPARLYREGPKPTAKGIAATAPSAKPAR